MDTIPNPADLTFPRQVECDLCGKVDNYNQGELISRIGNDWPKCCGRDMMIVPYEEPVEPAVSFAG